MLRRSHVGTLKKHWTRGQKGFSLIELLIVVSIVGIITAILIPNLVQSLHRAKQKSTVADIRNAAASVDDGGGDDGRQPHHPANASSVFGFGYDF